MMGWRDGRRCVRVAAIVGLLGLWAVLLACAPASERVVEGGGEGQAAGGAGEELSVMAGEVVWERGAVKLPAGAVLTVTLADTSLADAPWVVITEQVIEDAAELPAAFRLSYDAAEIEARREYTLSARVEVEGRLIYINDTVHTVLTGGSPATSDVTVIAVR